MSAPRDENKILRAVADHADRLYTLTAPGLLELPAESH